MRHTRDALDVFLFVSRNRVVSVEELAHAFNRSRFWAVGCLKLLADASLLTDNGNATYEAWHRNELDALALYVTRTLKHEKEERENGTQNDS